MSVCDFHASHSFADEITTNREREREKERLLGGDRYWSTGAPALPPPLLLLQCSPPALAVRPFVCCVPPPPVCLIFVVPPSFLSETLPTPASRIQARAICDCDRRSRHPSTQLQHQHNRQQLGTRPKRGGAGAKDKAPLPRGGGRASGGKTPSGSARKMQPRNSNGPTVTCRTRVSTHVMHGTHAHAPPYRWRRGESMVFWSSESGRCGALTRLCRYRQCFPGR